MQIIFNWIGGTTFILSIGNLNIAVERIKIIEVGSKTALNIKNTGK